MIVQASILNVATVNTRPAQELSVGFDVELCIYIDAANGDSLSLRMSESKGREVVEKLTMQLDKVEEIAQHRKESHQKMLDSLVALSGE